MTPPLKSCTLKRRTCVIWTVICCNRFGNLGGRMKSKLTDSSDGASEKLLTPKRLHNVGWKTPSESVVPNFFELVPAPKLESADRILLSTKPGITLFHRIPNSVSSSKL